MRVHNAPYTSTYIIQNNPLLDPVFFPPCHVLIIAQSCNAHTHMHNNQLRAGIHRRRENESAVSYEKERKDFSSSPCGRRQVCSQSPKHAVREL